MADTISVVGGHPDLSLAGIDEPEWNRFVANHPAATCFHDPAWGRLLAECYGFTPLVVTQRGTAGEITAGLPLLQVRRLSGRRHWLALPFSDECGPLAHTESARADVVAAADELRRQRHIS